MLIICPECGGTGILPANDMYYERPCESCHGVGTRPSNRDLKKAEHKRLHDKYEADKKAPKVLLRVSLPMFKRELDNLEIYASREVIKALEKYIVEK